MYGFAEPYPDNIYDTVSCLTSIENVYTVVDPGFERGEAINVRYFMLVCGLWALCWLAKRNNHCIVKVTGLAGYWIFLKSNWNGCSFKKIKRTTFITFLNW